MIPVASYCAGHATSAKPPGHLPVDDIAPGTASGRGTLSIEDAEVVTVKRRRARVRRIARLSVPCGLRDEIPQRTARRAAFAGPVQAVLRSRVAGEPLRVDAGRLAVVPRARIRALRLHERQAGLDRRQLVASDAAIENFLFSCGDVEHPASRRLHQRNGEWPGLVADDQFLAVRAEILEPPLLGKRDHERLAVALRGGRVGRVEQLATCRAEDREQGVDALCLAALCSARAASSGVANARGSCRRASPARDEDDQQQCQGSGERPRVHRRLPPPPDRPPRLPLPRELAERSREPLE